MASKTIIGSSVRLWVLSRPGIKEGQQGKIHRRLPHPLEHGPYDDHRDGFLSLLNAQAPLPWGDVVRRHSGSKRSSALRRNVPGFVWQGKYDARKLIAWYYRLSHKCADNPFKYL